MNDRAIEHAGLDPWEIRAHLERLGHDPAARLIRELVAALPTPSRSVGMTAPGRIRQTVVLQAPPEPMDDLEELGLAPADHRGMTDEAIAQLREEVADHKPVLTFTSRRREFAKPNFGPGVEVIPHKGEIS
jgi:hypothetical protein